MPYAELTIDQGATFESTLDLIGEDNEPIDVNGFVFTGQIRKSYYSTAPTANLTINITDSSNGNVVIFLDSNTTSNISPGRYVYDVYMKDGANIVTRIVEGIITVTPRVTRNG